ncbi:MAG: TetR/AcrR family transcriptional regulator [Azoarcus sp.]|jgi:AcrR family transcriptional regulator|nr:TetR/AcrR family transcriptional regulator [Azoarcus sp.]
MEGKFSCRRLATLPRAVAVARWKAFPFQKGTEMQHDKRSGVGPTPASATPKPRRLKHGERRAALLRAAKELSVEQNVAIPSLDAIIERAGGSRRSIYTEFGGKEGLRDALLAEISGEILPALHEGIDRDMDLRAALIHFARSLVSALMSEHGIGMSRLIMQDSFSSPARARTFYAKGPGKGLKLLADILEAARARGEIAVKDCASAAACFSGMVRGNLYLERVLRLRPPLSEAEIEAHVDTVVDIFLEGVRAR